MNYPKVGIIQCVVYEYIDVKDVAAIGEKNFWEIIWHLEAAIDIYEPHNIV